MSLLKQLETSPNNTQVALSDVLDQLPYNDQGLVPVIAQDHTSLEILMLAWMDRKAIETTLDEGQVCYFSRSRYTYWRKGETSGHIQKLISMHIDCDGDAILIKVDQTGPACHTNRSSCFYLSIDGDSISVEGDPA